MANSANTFNATFHQTEATFNATFEGCILVPVDRDVKPDTVPLDPPIWTNARDITVIEPDTLVSEDLNSKTITFAPQTNDYVETFDVPHNVKVLAITVFSIIGDKFYDCAREFNTSIVTHPDSSGTEIEYKRYEDNRGYAAGERKIRILFRKE